MKRLATALVAAGALFALSGCVHDPYYGDAYYSGGFYGSPNGGSGYGYNGSNGGSGYGYYGYGRRDNYGYNRGYDRPYRDRYYGERRYYRRY